MNVPPKRLYISKLPEFITKTDLESKFSHYGRIISIDINHRKNNVIQENQSALFAYVNLETSDEELFRCIRDFANKKWKGEFLDVQIAKESFLARLQREREEEKSKKEVSCIKTEIKQNINHGTGNKLYYDDHEEVKRKKIYFNEEGMDFKEEVVEDCLSLNGNGCSDYTTNTSVVKDPKHIEADQKRKSSNIEMRNQYRQKKLQIRAALSGLDGKSANKKIVFNTDQQTSNQSNNKQLFDEDSDVEETINLPIKPQFEGKEGHKLFQLQSRFQNDKRFEMNERFLENNENDKIASEDEKEQQLSILEKVLGKTVVAKDVKQKQPKVMLRFDPNDPQHKAYELKRETDEKKVQIKEKKRKKTTAPDDAEEVKPEVSKSKFYKVSDDLKGVFQSENKSFVLLSSNFADKIEVADQDMEQQTKEKQPVKEFNGTFNNLTSDDDNDEEEQEVVAQETKIEENKLKENSATERVRFWSEPFFFKEDDFRYQEGMDFIKRLGCQDNSNDFIELRRNVKEIVRAKVKNVNKKKGMFKKKLGGVKKRMKIKKALKR